MYLPNRVSTRASWGLSTFRPRAGNQPTDTQITPMTNRGMAQPWPLSKPKMLPSTIRATPARYSRRIRNSIAMPFFLLFNTISFMILAPPWI